MKRYFVLIIVLWTVLFTSVSVCASGIVIDGMPVAEDNVVPVIRSCEKFQVQLQEDNACGVRWIYSNKGVSETFSRAVSSGNRKCNCALIARWALRDAGYLSEDQGYFYGNPDGSLHISAKALTELESVCNLYHVNGTKTVNELINEGRLQAGDIVIMQSGVGHTWVYAGDGMAYEGGHAYTHGGSGEGAVFDSFYGPCKNGSGKVGYVIRPKDMDGDDPTGIVVDDEIIISACRSVTSVR